MRSACHWAVIAAAALLLCGAGGATTELYAQGLTGSIVGSVKDQTGGMLPGVTVAISSPRLIGGARTQATEPNGTFRFVALPTGDYTVKFELQGFQTIERKAVVEPDRTVTLDQTLGAAGVAEELTVTGEAPLVDVRGSQVATTVDKTIVEQVPVARRFSDLLNIMPGVQNGLYTFSPTNVVYGSRTTNNVYQVDGMSFVDPQVQSPVTDVAYDDIQEVQVSTSGQTAEFGSASGGVFNFITKSGGNTFKGVASGYFQTKGMNSNNITEDLKKINLRPSLKEHVYDGGGNLGGPILRDRLWFFGSLYRYSEDTRYSDFPVPTPVRMWQATVKLDGQLSAKHRLSFYGSMRDRLWDYWNYSYTIAGDKRAWLGITYKNWLTSAGWTYLPDSKTVVQVRGGLALFDIINRELNVVKGSPVYTESTTSIITGGPTQSAGTAQRDRYELKGDVSRFIADFAGGRHDLKAGVSYEALRMDTERRDQSGDTYVRHTLLNGQPYRVQLMAGPGHNLYKIDHLAGFVQDQWGLGRRLTFNLGVRLDHWNASLGPDTFGGGPWFPPENPAEQKGVLPLTHVAPRIGGAWDITGTRRFALKASYGRFYQRIAGTDISGLSKNYQGGLTYDWIDRNGNMKYDPGEEGTLRSDGRRAVFPEADPNLKMPYSDSFNFGVEVQLPHAFGIAVNGIFKREKDFRSLFNRARPFNTAYDLVTVTNPISTKTMQVYSLKPEFQTVQAQNFLTNPSDPVPLWCNYNGVEFVVRRRLQDRWMMQASYNLGRVYGTVGSLFWDSQGNPYSSPNNLIFVNGDQSFDRRHMVKLIGLYEVPYGIQLSGEFEYMTGLPLMTDQRGGTGVTGAYWVRYLATNYPQIRTSAFIDVPGEPQGTHHFDAQMMTNFRAQKRTRLGGSATVDVMLDVFNLLNRSTIVRVESINTSQTNFLRPGEIVTPRAARIGLRFGF